MNCSLHSPSFVMSSSLAPHDIFEMSHVYTSYNLVPSLYLAFSISSLSSPSVSFISYRILFYPLLSLDIFHFPRSLPLLLTIRAHTWPSSAHHPTHRSVLGWRGSSTNWSAVEYSHTGYSCYIYHFPFFPLLRMRIRATDQETNCDVIHVHLHHTLFFTVFLSVISDYENVSYILKNWGSLCHFKLIEIRVEEFNNEVQISKYVNN